MSVIHLINKKNIFVSILNDICCYEEQYWCASSMIQNHLHCSVKQPQFHNHRANTSRVSVFFFHKICTDYDQQVQSRGVAIVLLFIINLVNIDTITIWFLVFLNTCFHICFHKYFANLGNLL